MNDKVMSILEGKIRHIDGESGEIYLVGPIRLPIQLEEAETAIFQWYCWLLCDEATDRMEDIIDKLSGANLAEMQQSSVLVYGDFAEADEALISNAQHMPYRRHLRQQAL